MFVRLRLLLIKLKVSPIPASCIIDTEIVIPLLDTVNDAERGDTFILSSIVTVINSPKGSFASPDDLDKDTHELPDESDVAHEYLLFIHNCRDGIVTVLLLQNTQICLLRVQGQIPEQSCGFVTMLR